MARMSASPGFAQSGKPLPEASIKCVFVRVPPSEHDALCRAAKAAGMTLTQFCRSVLRQAVSQSKP